MTEQKYCDNCPVFAECANEFDEDIEKVDCIAFLQTIALKYKKADEEGRILPDIFDITNRGKS